MSALRPSDLAEFTKRRRLVADPDLEAYLVQKARLLSLVSEAAKGDVDLTSDDWKTRVEGLRWDLELAHRRSLVAAKTDAFKAEQLQKQLDTFDTTTANTLQRQLSAAQADTDKLQGQLQVLQELLSARTQAVRLLEQYRGTKGRVTITREEAETLFGSTDGAAEVLKRGKLVEKGEHTMQDIFELQTGDLPSIGDLSTTLEAQQAQCSKIALRAEASRARWLDAAGKLNAAIKGVVDVAPAIEES